MLNQVIKFRKRELPSHKSAFWGLLLFVHAGGLLSFARSMGIGMCIFYLILFGVFPTSSLAEKGNIASDLVAFSRIQEAIPKGENCESLMSALREKGVETANECSAMVSIGMNDYPMVILHSCENQLVSRTINWLPWE